MTQRQIDKPVPDPVREMQRGLRWLIIATIVLYLGVVVIGLLAWSNALTTQKALCQFRGDLTSRVVGGEKFLKAHPDGAFGISADEIQTQLDNQRRTVKALSILSC